MMAIVPTSAAEDPIESKRYKFQKTGILSDQLLFIYNTTMDYSPLISLYNRIGMMVEITMKQDKC